MASSNVQIKLDNTLGAGYLGTLIACIIYGIGCVQAYNYFTNESRDSRFFKAVIAFLWLLDSTHVVVIGYIFYYYLITNYGNPAVLAQPTWGFNTQVYLTAIGDLIMRGIFGKRIWILSSRSYVLAGAIGVVSLATAGFAVAFSARAQTLKTYARSHEIGYLLYIGYVICAVADALIAGSLCFFLSRNRTGFRKSDSLINGLMLYAINTSLLTSLCSISSFITFAIWPNQYTYIAIYFSLSKLYFNSLLAMLNSRRSLAEKITGVKEITMPTLRSRPISLGHSTQPALPTGSINVQAFGKFDAAHQLA